MTWQAYDSTRPRFLWLAALSAIGLFACATPSTGDNGQGGGNGSGNGGSSGSHTGGMSGGGIGGMSGGGIGGMSGGGIGGMSGGGVGGMNGGGIGGMNGGGVGGMERRRHRRRGRRVVREHQHRRDQRGCVGLRLQQHVGYQGSVVLLYRRLRFDQQLQRQRR